MIYYSHKSQNVLLSLLSDPLLPIHVLSVLDRLVFDPPFLGKERGEGGQKKAKVPTLSVVSLVLFSDTFSISKRTDLNNGGKSRWHPTAVTSLLLRHFVSCCCHVGEGLSKPKQLAR